jgi:uncharacterized membrane protein (DUF2068 family)
MAAMGSKSADRSVAIILIGVFKLLKALLLVCVSITAFHLVNKDLGDTIERWARELRVDPGNHFVQSAISHALNVSPRKLELVGAVALIYAGMFGTEGVGLLLGKRWAEYMTVITTAGLLPLEIFEIVKKTNGVKIATLIINVAAVVYLVIRLWNAPKHTQANARPEEAPKQTA